MAGVIPVEVSRRQRQPQAQQTKRHRDRMSAEPALAGFVVSAALTRLTILLRLEGLLPASRRAKPVRLIRSRAIRLAPSANRRGVGLWCLHERLVAPLSTIAL